LTRNAEQAFLTAPKRRRRRRRRRRSQLLHTVYSL